MSMHFARPHHEPFISPHQYLSQRFTPSPVPFHHHYQQHHHPNGRISLAPLVVNMANGAAVAGGGTTGPEHTITASESANLGNLIAPPLTPPLIPQHHHQQQRAVAVSEKWNSRDDETLMQARAAGHNWGPIQQAHFPTKTPNACRKRHERLMEKKGADDWSIEQLEKLGKEYVAMRKDMWSPLATKMNEKWQVVEKKVLERGLKNIQSSGRSALKRDRESGTTQASLDFDLEPEEDDSAPQSSFSQVPAEYSGSRHKRQCSSFDRQMGNLGRQ